MVTDCNFSGNTANNGGGMYNEDSSSPMVTNCTFSGNMAGSSGGGMFNRTNGPTVTNCTFRGNTAVSSGGGMDNELGSSPMVTQCTFSGNSAGNAGGGMSNNFSMATMTNCTFSGNMASGGTGLSEIVSTTTLTNCILWDDIGPELAGGFIITYSNVRGGSLGTGNIDIDPRFADADGLDDIPGTDDDDLRLDPFSHCIDAGDNTAPDLVGITEDLDGNPRFVDDANVADAGVGTAPIVDMGVYERQTDSFNITVVLTPLDSVQATIDSLVDGDEIVLNPGTYNEVINFNGKEVLLRSTDPSDPAIVAATILDGTGLASPVITCDSGEGSVTIIDGLTIINGDAINGGGMFNLSSSPTVTNCTFSGNTASSSGGGMYNLSSSPTVTNCTFSGNTASTSGGGMYNFDGSSPRVTDCTFSGNTASSSGGGMYNDTSSNPMVTNCTFSGNMASNSGGGMGNFSQSSPTVINSTFSGNSANNGGGMSNEAFSSPMVTNCTFSGNTASNAGGGMYILTSDPPVTNCTFSGNMALGGSGLWEAGGSTTLTNCILWGDIGDELLGSFIVTYSNVQGGSLGVGNIDIDPIYIDADGLDDIPGTDDDDLRLTLFSLCIDAGDNGSIPTDAADLDGDSDTVEPTPWDLDGNPRVNDGDFDTVAIVDMGAYELDLATTAFTENLTQSTRHLTFADAIAAAISGDELVGSIPAFPAEPDFNFNNKALTLRSAGSITQPAGGTYTMADNSALEANVGDNINLDGALAVLFGDRVEIGGNSINIGATGSMSFSIASVVDIMAPGGLVNQGAISFTGASLGVTGGILNDATGELIGYGDIEADITNDNSATYVADTQVVGNYLNNGTTTIQNGTLTIIGILTNNGTVTGDVAGGAAKGLSVAAGGGLAVIGDYAAGAGASLVMSSPQLTVKIAGNFDVAIDDSARFDLAEAELRLIGVAGAVQNLEIMSLDVGASSGGFDRMMAGHYPIGTLRIGPGATTVNMVDNHDNDLMGQGQREAVYVENLVIDVGATLNISGCTVYYQTLQLDGTVDEPLNLVEIPACIADATDDGMVGIDDFLGVLANWSPCVGPACDFDSDNDGIVGILDFLRVLAEWGACP